MDSVNSYQAKTKNEATKNVSPFICMTKEFSQIQHRQFPIINNEKHSNFFQKTTLFQLQQNESQLPLRISSTNFTNKFKAHNSQHLINRGCRTIVLHLLETNLTSDLYQWPWTSSEFDVNLCRWRETYNCKLPSMTKQKNPFPYILLKKVITTDLKYYSLKQIKIGEKHLEYQYFLLSFNEEYKF